MQIYIHEPITAVIDFINMHLYNRILKHITILTFKTIIELKQGY